MIKNILFVAVALFFAACSQPNQNTNTANTNLNTQLKEANVCQKITDNNQKVACYNKILPTNSFAQLRFGNYFLAKKNYNQAMKFLQNSFKAKNPFANLPLAVMYGQGLGVEKNIKTAVGLLQASSGVDPKAAFNLARIYLNGKPTQETINKGIALLDFAAKKNHKTAQQSLVNIYTKGLFGVQKNAQQANYWANTLKNNKTVFTYDRL